MVWLLFIMCTMFNTIVMLNLLIAIISETFSKVNSKAINASFKEMATIIMENGYLVPLERKISYCEKNKYLIIARTLNSGEGECGHSMEAELDDLSKMVK